MVLSVLNRKKLLTESSPYSQIFFEVIGLNVKNIDLEDVLRYCPAKKVHVEYVKQDEGHLTIKVLSKALKQTKKIKYLEQMVFQ